MKKAAGTGFLLSLESLLSLSSLLAVSAARLLSYFTTTTSTSPSRRPMWTPTSSP